MESIQSYFQYSQILFAAYAVNLDTGAGVIQALTDAGFTTTQAEKFLANGWKIVSQSSDTLYGASGYSGTLFHNTQTGEYVFANRGTAGAQDLWTDAWGITMLGVAGAQIIDMYRYYKQLTAPAGQAVVYTEDEIDLLHGLGAVYNPFQFATPGMVRDYVAQDKGLGQLDPGQSFTVAGHSLGGVLNSAATVAAGLFTGGVSTVLDSSNISNVYGDSGPAIIAGVGGAVGANHPVAIEAKGNLDSVLGGLYNHSIVTLTDALAVAALMQKLDPALNLARINTHLKNASNTNAAMLEAVVDGLGKLLGVESKTAQDDRIQLYNNLHALQNNTYFQMLQDRVQVIAAPANSLAAKDDFGVLLSLAYLTPFALKPNDSVATTILQSAQTAIGAKWVEDKNLSTEDRDNGQARFSDAWLADRASMLSWLVKRNVEERIVAGNDNNWRIAA